jgi:hypothetical protein
LCSFCNHFFNLRRRHKVDAFNAGDRIKFRLLQDHVFIKDVHEE